MKITQKGSGLEFKGKANLGLIVKTFINMPIATLKDITMEISVYDFLRALDKTGEANVKHKIKQIEEYVNPYPKDIFCWDNKEALKFNRGRFNRHCFEIVENVRRDIIKELKEARQK